VSVTKAIFNLKKLMLPMMTGHEWTEEELALIYRQDQAEAMRQGAERSHLAKKGYRCPAKTFARWVDRLMSAVKDDEDRDLFPLLVESLETSFRCQLLTKNDLRWALLCLAATATPRTKIERHIVEVLSEGARQSGIRELRIGPDLDSLVVNGKAIRRETMIRYCKPSLSKK
jgi:hypothetical protein